MYKVIMYLFDTRMDVIHIEKHMNQMESQWTPIMQSQSTDSQGNSALVVTYKRISPEVDGF